MMFSVVTTSLELISIEVNLEDVRTQSIENGDFPEFIIEREFLKLFSLVEHHWGEQYTQSSAFVSLHTSIGEFMKNALDADANHFFIDLRCLEQSVSITLLNDGMPFKKALCGVFSSSAILNSEKSSSSTYGGAGLGLKISALIVESTGGTLTVGNLVKSCQDCTSYVRLDSSMQKSLTDEIEAKELIEKKGKRCSSKDLLALQHSSPNFFKCDIPHTQACAPEQDKAPPITLSILRARRTW